MKLAWCGALAFAVTGCLGTPTPLVPGLSGSVGAPHHGVQTGAVELPKRGPGFVRYRPDGNTYWGNPHLVRTIERAAAAVADSLPGGPPLVLGDLSVASGGKIPRHNSHRTGRDIDALWFVKSIDGAPVQSPGFIRMGGDGLAFVPETGDYLRLDLEREWLLVKALVSADDIGVQWLFCSEPVEALIIDYARARGEPPEIVWRAETVLLQPGDSLPHDDHLHVRIACSPDELVAGCEGGGPYWEWLPPIPNLPEGQDWIYQLVSDDPLPSDAEEQRAATAENQPHPEG